MFKICDQPEKKIGEIEKAKKRGVVVVKNSRKTQMY